MRMEIAFIHEGERPAESASVAMILPGNRLIQPKEHLMKCRTLSKEMGIPVVTAPFAYEGGAAMAWIGKGQEILQQACFPDDGFQKGGDVNVFDTPWGPAALCCDADIFQPQYARLAAFKGCKCLMASTARIRIDSVCEYMPEDLPACGDRGLFFVGPWASAQANGIAVAAAGRTGGALILPCALTPRGSGLGESGFDPADLARAHREFPVYESMNPKLYERYRKELEA
ncbi:MAG TPA: hypothetical protein PK854_03485 [Oscillospiraceae bacterium]|nr:hypothetical protein [Oscillospiraceae bacterium]HPS34308.1 hypothetical protein [Oscillospiraceae bacterium]